MSRVVIVAIGSRGDVAPLTGVGVALTRAGHHVTVAAFTPFTQMITSAGLAAAEIPAEMPQSGDVNPMKSLAAFASPNGMRALGRSTLDAVADEPADIALLSPFAEMAGHPWAEARGIPSIGVRLQPLSATAQYPPAVLGPWSAGRAGNRTAGRAGAWLIDGLYGGVVAGFRRDLGLPRKSARSLRAERTLANWPVLHGYSHLVVPRPPDWRPGLDVTGYWWPAADPEWVPPRELTDFLSDGPPPIFVGFGSMMTTGARADELSDIIRRAARHAGTRMLVQAGWARLDSADDNLLTIGETPHDWLFPRVAAVAHHCGAGTTAAGLRAGIPTIPLPAYGDGPFWAKRITALGVAAPTVNQRGLTAERLGYAMRVALDDERIRANARQLGIGIAAEDGAAEVVCAVGSLSGG